MIYTHGMTLIELMFILLFAIATSYLAFAAYKPAQQWQLVDFTLAQNSDIVMALQAYHNLYGHWPDEFNQSLTGKGCGGAWDVLTGSTTSFQLTAGRGTNGFGSQYQFSCEPGQILAPLIMTQSVPLKYLDYFRRYFYRVELPATLPSNENEFVSIKTRVPPTDVSKNIYLSQVDFGTAHHFIQEAQAIKKVAITGLHSRQGFVPMPEACRGLDLVHIDVFSTGVCPLMNLKKMPFLQKLSYNFDIDVTALPAKHYDFQGKIVIQRMISLASIDHEATPCKITPLSALSCDSIALNQSDGWRVESSMDLKAVYKVQYFALPPPDLSGFPRQFLVYEKHINSGSFNSRASFERVLFQREELLFSYVRGIRKMVRNQTISGDDVPQISVSLVTLGSKPAFDQRLFLTADQLRGSDTCAGPFTATVERDLPHQFNAMLGVILHCAG